MRKEGGGGGDWRKRKDFRNFLHRRGRKRKILEMGFNFFFKCDIYIGKGKKDGRKKDTEVNKKKWKREEGSRKKRKMNLENEREFQKKMKRNLENGRGIKKTKKK